MATPCNRNENDFQIEWLASLGRLAYISCMDQTEKTTETQPTEGPAESRAETVVQAVGRKVGSTVGTIAAKVTGSSTKRSANAYAERRLVIKKKKRSAHRRKLKASHTKG